MRILICPDSYKGSATAPEVAQAIREGIAYVDGSIECISLPVADGGEGSVSVIASWKLPEPETWLILMSSSAESTSAGVSQPNHTSNHW